MSARDDILARARITSAGARPPIARTYRAAGSVPTDVEQFVDRLVDYRAVVHRCAPDDLVATVHQALAGARSVVAPAGVPDEWTGGFEYHADDPQLSPARLDAIDAVVTACALAIAETGTIVLDHGRGQGRRALTLVPDHHVVVVRAEQVVATVPDAIAALAPGATQTWISGPSATSDIELNRIEGVHGPRRLHVVVVG